jgi:hypothetical protein
MLDAMMGIEGKFEACKGKSVSGIWSTKITESYM